MEHYRANFPAHLPFDSHIEPGVCPQHLIIQNGNENTPDPRLIITHRVQDCVCVYIFNFTLGSKEGHTVFLV